VISNQINKNKLIQQGIPQEQYLKIDKEPFIEDFDGNQYCGASTSKLIYPNEDIVDYLSLRCAEFVLTNEWCKIDEDFDAEYRQYKIEITDGMQSSEPNQDKKYPNLIKKYSTGIYAHPFFKYIHRSTEIFNEDGYRIDNKANCFVNAIEELICQVIDTDDKLLHLKHGCIMDEQKLYCKKYSEMIVEEMEFSLSHYKTHIIDNVQEKKYYVLNQVLKEGCNKARLTGDEDFRLNAWILKRKEPLHPVAVRYFLYQVKNIIDDKILRLNNDNKRLKEAINNYKDKYFFNGQIISAVEYIRAYQDQSFFGKIVKNRFKAATDYYISKSHEQLKKLNKFSVNFLTELVFTEIVNDLSEMLDDWKYFFRSMSEIRFKLSTEIATRAIENDSTSDQQNRFAYASKRAKNYIWENIKPSLLQVNKLSPNIYKVLYLGQYQLFCQRRDLRYYNTEKIKEINVEKQFREIVVGWYKKILKKHVSIDINVISALKKQAQLYEKESSSYIKEELSIIDRLANPYINNNVSKSESHAYWRIHPACMDLLTQQDINFVFSDPENIVKDETLSPYEVVRYRRILAKDIHKNNDDTSKNVFISYSHKDKEIVDKIKLYLDNSNIKVTIDSKSMEPGERIEKFIENSIRKNDVILSIVSENSLLSAWVAIETLDTISAEKLSQKKLIPCCIDSNLIDFNFKVTQNLINQIKEEIKQIKDAMHDRLNDDVGTEDLQSSLTRYSILKTNIASIITRIKDYKYINLTETEFDNGMISVIEYLK